MRLSLLLPAIHLCATAPERSHPYLLYLPNLPHYERRSKRKGHEDDEEGQCTQPKPNGKGKAADAGEKNPAEGASAAGDPSQADGDVSPGGGDEVRSGVLSYLSADLLRRGFDCARCDIDGEYPSS